MPVRQNNWPHRNMGLSRLFTAIANYVTIRNSNVDKRYLREKLMSFLLKKKLKIFYPILKNDLSM
jgi:hypothetical protein